tara:strand:+ start:278 stop:547 length:270 start_codon:yes stop_codon:yes gene_type:complete
MNKLKKTIYLIIVIFTFSSCQKCVECTAEDIDGDNYQWQVMDDNGNVETFGDQIVEICSDNFESKKDFNDYIDELEKEYDYNCVGDMFN